jgi:hypothetical protein
MARIQRVQPGEPISAATFNALVDAVNALLGMTAAGGIKLLKHPGGLHLAQSGNPLALRLGKLDGTLAFGGSAMCSFWTGGPGSEADSAQDATVYCWLLQAGESIANGSKVVVALINGYWQVIAAACP